jgi:hypothetical protein
VFERLRESVGRLELLLVLVEEIARRDEDRLRLSKEVAAQLGAAIKDLRTDIGLLPRGRGRPLAEIEPNFRQEVLRLHTENGWGRPRIAEAMGVSESKVRRVLEEAAGAKPFARRRGP